MIVSDVADLPAFLRARLDASANAVAGRPAELRIGDPVVLLSDTSERDAFPAGRDDRARVKGAACTS
jgi:hypothetical protein